MSQDLPRQDDELNNLPKWLHSMDGAEETPDWLRRLSQAGEETAFGASELPAAEEVDLSEAVPDWLSDVRGEPATAGEAKEPTLFEAPEEQVPEWFRDIGSAETAAPVDAFAFPSEGEMPDWSAGLGSEAAEPATPPAAAQPAQEDIPDWFAGLDLSGTGEPALAEPEPAVEPALPDWLSGIDQGAGTAEITAIVATPAETAEPATAGESQIPEWLLDIQQEADQMPAATSVAAPALEESEDIPDWLKGGGIEFAGAPAAAPFQESETLQAEEIPDWLKGTAGEPPVIEVQAAPAEEGLPDWLKGTPVEPMTVENTVTVESTVTVEDTAAGEYSTTEEQAALVQEDLPDWFTRTQEKAVPSAQEADLEHAPEESLPDWLSEMALEQKTPAPGATAFEATAFEAATLETRAADKQPELPDWLSAFKASDEEQTAEEEPVEEAPDWLAGLEALTVQDTAAVQDTASTETVEALPQTESQDAGEEQEVIPDWLAAVQGIGEETTPEAVFKATLEEPQAATEGLESLPDWLQAVEPVSLLEEEQPEPEEERPEATAQAGQPPEWVEQLDMSRPAKPGEAETYKPGTIKLPSWLQETSRERPGKSVDEILSFEPTLEPGAPPEALLLELEEQAVAEKQIPPPAGDMATWIDWLRSRSEPVIDQNLAVETSGPLAGLRGLLNPEPLLGLFSKSTYKPAQPIPDSHLNEAKIFEQILSAPPGRPTAAVQTQGQQIVASLGRWLIYLLLLGVMVAAAFFPAPLSGLIRPSAVDEPMEETHAFYHAIEGLPQGSTALLVADFDASLDGELTPQARAIVRHLRNKQVDIAAISLTPQGAAIMQDLFAQDGSSSEHVLNLGYLPPHPASLQAFVSSPIGGTTLMGTEEDPARTVLGSKIARFDGFNLVVIISGSDEHVRWWLEQVGSQYPISTVAALSASIAPYIQPYYRADDGQIRGMVVGLAGAADYEQQLTSQLSLDYAQGNLVLQGYGQLVLVLIMIVGSIVSALKKGK